MTGRPAVVAPRIVVRVVGTLTGVLAVTLWILQVRSLLTPCTVPGCVWPRLSATGFASLAELGVTPGGWAVIASGLGVIWSAVPFLLGVAIARTDSGSWLPLLWFLFALGTLSAVPGNPVLMAILRTITLVAWFTLFALFPTGRFRPRWVAIAPILAVCWTMVLSLPFARAAEAANDRLWWGLESAVYVTCVAIIVAGQIVQFVRAEATGRRVLRLLLIPLALFVLFGIVSGVFNARMDPDSFGYGTLGGAVLYEISSFLTMVLLACIAVATLRDEAYGVRIAVDRVLVVSVVIAVAVAFYAAVALAASTVLSGWLASAIAAVLTAVALAGLFGRITRGLGRLIYGEADDPAAVVTALDAKVADATTPAELLPGIASVLAARLRFPAVRITLAGPDPTIGATGALTEPTARAPLALGGRSLGEIRVTLRPGQRRLTRRDRTALAAAAGPVAAAATARRLSEELRRSRMEVLISRDDERRALRRRLHDEIGPTLALAGHRISAAHQDPTQLAAAAHTLADAVSQVRSISRDLRPPELDELGLRAAIAAFATGLHVHAEVSAPEHIAPGVVEVALYRIVVEALLNVERHARATRAIVTLSAAKDRWTLDIDDDGIGIPVPLPAGVGIASMRERAGELGGRVEIVTSPLGGVRVQVEIPQPHEESP